jgi:hypothetical protein
VKGQYRKKSKKALQVACLSACLITAWAAAPNYAIGDSGGDSYPVPEPASIALAAVGVTAVVLAHKKTSRKQ